MNYDTGNGKIIPTTAQESKFSQSAPLITFPQPVGGVSHPHMALEHEGEVLVPDLVCLDLTMKIGYGLTSFDIFRAEILFGASSRIPVLEHTPFRALFLNPKEAAPGTSLFLVRLPSTIHRIFLTYLLCR